MDAGWMMSLFGFVFSSKYIKTNDFASTDFFLPKFPDLSNYLVSTVLLLLIEMMAKIQK